MPFLIKNESHWCFIQVYTYKLLDRILVSMQGTGGNFYLPLAPINMALGANGTNFNYRLYLELLDVTHTIEWRYCHVDRDASLSVHIILLHHYVSDFAHISDLYSLVIVMYKSEI